VSTSAGTPEPGNGRPPAEPRRRRDLRDSTWGRILILVALLAFALLVSKSCASNSNDISQQEAVDLAVAHASFTPCEREVCRQVRYLNQGIPPVGYWGVVLSESVNAQGRPSRTQSFLVNATTGEVTRKS
jgi:hypothetical protein